MEAKLSSFAKTRAVSASKFYLTKSSNFVRAIARDSGALIARSKAKLESFASMLKLALLEDGDFGEGDFG